MSRSTSNQDVCTELFNRIYDNTFVEMRKFVAVKCSDTSYISDILQEIYWEYYKLILKKGSDYAANNRAVLYKIANRKIYRYYSLKEKMKNLIPLYQVNDEDDEYTVTDLCEQGDISEEVMTEMESERIWQIISGYPADVRKIFYLFFYEGMSHSKIAKALNCGLSNVKTSCTEQ